MTLIIFAASGLAAQPRLCQIEERRGSAQGAQAHSGTSARPLRLGCHLTPTHRRHRNLTDFAHCFPWWLETGSWGHASVPFPSPPSRCSESSFPIKAALQLPLRSCFPHRIPCNTYSHHCKHKKNTTGGLGHQNKWADI